MKYKIKWRNRTNSLKVIEGISRYNSKEKAEKQVEKWKRNFPSNTYYVERCKENI